MGRYIQTKARYVNEITAVGWKLRSVVICIRRTMSQNSQDLWENLPSTYLVISFVLTEITFL